jgi:RNA polymerase sigma factor (sigma-70 family)
MRGEMEEGSPVFAAPGSKSSRQSSAIINGTTDEEIQALSDEQLDLVNRYLPLAYSLTKGYHNKGRSPEELRAGAENRLLDAALRFDPSLGFPFAAHARPWIKGGITAIFKKRKIDQCTIGFGALQRTDGKESEEFDPADERNALPPIDLGSLEDRERQIVEARLAGETLKKTGAELGISPERVRQIESKAHEKLRKGDELTFRVAPGDREARQFGDEYKACRGSARALITRHGYQKPSRNTVWLENSRLEQNKYEGRCLAAEEIAEAVVAEPRSDDATAYKPINSHGNPFCLFPKTSKPKSYALPLINRGNGFVSMRRDSEYNPMSHDPYADYARTIAKAYRHLPPRTRAVYHHPPDWAPKPKPSSKLERHHANAARLAELRGNAPLRRVKGPCGGPVIHGWRG